ncbi:hypothetical protein LSM04_005807 [Trypanosoma melophagium]|uniref:uncharacterized protein n=1 Tax=Trypanosoma melophagium TaxID=715481 RepID=UPI00351A755D|nr:hypothetical protein LSM04_005807 [Trypanosoma melophagium]
MSDVGGHDTTITNNNRSVVGDSSDVQQSATAPRHQSFFHNTVREHNDNVLLNMGSRHDLNEASPLPLKDTNIDVNDNTNIENSNENPFAPRTLPTDHRLEQEGQCNSSERNPFSLDMRPQPDQGNSMEPNLNLTSKELQGGEATLTVNEYNVLEGRRIPQDDSGVAILHIQPINETKPHKSRRRSVEFPTHENDILSQLGQTQNSHHKRRRYSGDSQDSQNSSIFSSSSSKKRTFSLRCWVLCPLVLMLLLVAIVAAAATLVMLINNNQRAFSALQDLVFSIMESPVGRLAFSKMVNMAHGTGSMYFSNNTFVNPLTDQLMPIENGMMSRLCAILRDVDPEHSSIFHECRVVDKGTSSSVCLFSFPPRVICWDN